MANQRPPFGMHLHSAWEMKALDRNVPLPLWLRISFLAYSRHGMNGHANFKRGELAELLRRVDPETGEILHEIDGHNLRREIRRAVKYGYLAEGSGSRCLVVPPTIHGGNSKRPMRCPVHDRKKGVSQ